MGWDLCVGLLYEHRFAVLIRKCDNDRESYDDRKCGNDRESYRVPKKVAPGFWPFSLAGGFYMDRNNAV